MNITRGITTLIGLALAEDIADADITTQATVDAGILADAEIIAREPLVVCGHAIVEAVFKEVDPKLKYKVEIPDGAKARDGQRCAIVSGKFGSILSGERTALNFLQRMSGISTLSAEITALVSDLKVKILDTRKTTPGWRVLEKYAVKTGGGENHRQGLFDAYLIKNNHIDALGGDVAQTIRLCKEHRLKLPKRSSFKIEVEVRNISELNRALSENPDAILLDNISPKELKIAVATIRNFQDRALKGGDKIFIEASGGINRKTIREYADTGVDGISLGMLTHSATAVDFSLRYLNKQ